MDQHVPRRPVINEFRGDLLLEFPGNFGVDTATAEGVFLINENGPKVAGVLSQVVAFFFYKLFTK